MTNQDLRALTDVCVHCGFCLPACPTYQLWGEEMDSPRGRIHLVQQMLDGAPVTPTIAGHLDACLGCLACVPACPSGVRYDRIVTQARVQVEDSGVRTVGQKALRAGIFALFPHPYRLRALRGPLAFAGRIGLTGSRAMRMLPRPLRAMAELAPPVRRRSRLPRRLSPRPIGGSAPRPTRVVGLLTGCVQSAFFSHVTEATARVLALAGCEVVIPRRQGCCGALAHHSGLRRQAVRRARHTIAAFERAGVDTVVTDVAGCGSAMKEYADLLGDDPQWALRAGALAAKVRDVTELLAELGGFEPGGLPQPSQPMPLTVAYHDACHLSNGQGVRSQPRGLLRGIPGLRLVSGAGADVCCGSAGIYNLVQPDAAAQLGARKAAALRATGADVIVTGNPGCALQIAAAMRRDGGPEVPVLHTVELLYAALDPSGGDGLLADLRLQDRHDHEGKTLSER